MSVQNYGLFFYQIHRPKAYCSSLEDTCVKKRQYAGTLHSYAIPGIHLSCYQTGPETTSIPTTRGLLPHLAYIECDVTLTHFDAISAYLIRTNINRLNYSAQCDVTNFEQQDLTSHILTHFDAILRSVHPLNLFQTIFQL